MKRFLYTLLSLAVILSLAISASAVGEKMTAAKGTPTIDGEIDSIWDTTERVQLTHIKAGDLKGDGTLPDTCSVYARMLWDETALYFLFEIYDDDFGFLSTEGDWKNDSIYLYIDEVGSLDATWKDGQSQNALIPEEGYTMVPRKGTAPAEYQLEYTYPTDESCVMEFKYVPSIISASTFAEGLELSIDFQYNDCTEYGTRDYCFGWSDDSDNASNTSACWGVVTLAGAPSEAADESAEEPADETVVDTSVTEPAEETPEVTEAAPEEANETVEPSDTVTAPQTFDNTLIIAAITLLTAFGAFTLNRKVRN